MAPFPQNNTHRMFFDYVTGVTATSRAHTCAVRYNPGLRDVSDVQADFLALLNAFGPTLFRAGWKVTGVRVQSQGTNFTLPVTVISTLGAFIGTAGTGYDASLEAVEDTFQGRSPGTGRRVDLSLYRAHLQVSGNFRIIPGTGTVPTAVGAAVAVLNTRAPLGSFLAIDGLAPSWYGYMNQNYNSYWESRSRTT